MLDVIGAGVLGYLIGSLPTGIWLSRLSGRVDPRSGGSGGSGATNVYRLHGAAMAAAVLLADIGKGTLATALAAELGGAESARLPAVALLAAVAGHAFPVLAGFRGGKGVATFFGGALWLAPLQAALAGGVFVATLLLARRVSVASIAAVILFPLLLTAAAEIPAVVGCVALAAVLIILHHRTNLRRLRAGTEPPIF